jgi:hypothetical protein
MVFGNSNGGVSVKIIDTFSSFPKHPSIEKLRAYYERYPGIFRYYFSYHCKDTEERLEQAMERYMENLCDIKKVHQTIKPLVLKVVRKFYSNYQLEFPINIHFIIGAYGSNAYATREIIPDITFALERLTYKENPLQVIIAHEIGHVAHHIISNNHHMNWTMVKWDHPYIWLLQEGAATHFSKQIVPDLMESIYFSYDYDGDEWMDFAKKNKKEIISKFANDIHAGKDNLEIFKEWFSINGGAAFGYNRLAYFIADSFFQDVIRKKGELNTLLLWKQKSFIQVVDDWLRNKAVL